MTMRIQKTDVIAGLPAFEARRLLRLLGESWANPGQMRRIHPEADIAKFEAEGLVEKRFWGSDPQPYYEVTDRGRACRKATAAKPIHRKTADKILAAFLDRVWEVNNNPDLLYTVEQVRVFGSYLRSEVERLGDLDIAIKMVFREEKVLPGEQSTDTMLRRARAADRRFSSYAEQLYWPETEIHLFLRNGSKSISLTTVDNAVLKKCPSQVVWTRETAMEVC